MTHLALGVLLGLVGEDGDLLSLAVLNYLSCNACACNVGSADGEAVVGTDCYYLIKGVIGCFFGAELPLI